MTGKFESVDEYIASFEGDAKSLLQRVRSAVRQAAPDAEETIRYNVPTYRLNGRSVVHFAGWKEHISLYPVPDGDAAFEKRIRPYRSGKGTLRFPLDRPIPFDLITGVVELLIQERGTERL